MERLSLVPRLLAYAFLWLLLSEGSWATRREDLERAAELAVERSAERAAERAVEKALESGNSTTETETIRESYSSVRKYDKSVQLPREGYTPAQRHEYDRIMREREAAERASALIKRSIPNEGFSGHLESPMSNDDWSLHNQHQHQHYHENSVGKVTPDPLGKVTYDPLGKVTLEPLGRVNVAKQHPLSVGGQIKYEAAVGVETNGAKNDVRKMSSGHQVHQVVAWYPVKIFPVQRTEQHQQLYIVPVTESPSQSTVYPHYIDYRGSRFAKTGDYSIVREDEYKRGPAHH